ncbi:RNA 2',3'-cyclic phosphodiesterase [Maribellus luteus]|uniref:RNA 2',3'-cyclic phosphodiesterase n=1 Tax=Maribellus luteus TaxID=2305463 RepID=A0A399SSN5_9BACT|nr:RNA 2',3'-cyclic phosphodiesterase [Maribellus luteus]RIJ46840.1 RNA 2',3'-cyclic phosphodiesterase [Maribellus luteus]
MNKEIRTFVAVKIIPEKALMDQFQQFKSIFRGDGINWVQEDNFHLTLRFLGNTSRFQAEQLSERFAEVASGFTSFEFAVKGVGYFKSKGSPRVLFLKISDSEQLSALASEIETSVVAAGFQEEQKAFRPHLTLGRIKHLGNRNRFCSIVDDLPEALYQRVKVSEFIFYQSILRPEGPVYQPIETFQLK